MPVEPDNLNDLLRGLRDCATRYTFQPAAKVGGTGKSTRPLEDAFFRADRLDDRLLGQVGEYLGRELAPSEAQVRGVMAVQQATPSLLSLLRGPRLTNALPQAEAVICAWVGDAGVGRRERKDLGPLFLGATFLLRCVAPTRWPIVARPEDLLDSATRSWTTLDKFFVDYRKQVRAVARVARQVGMLDPMRLHDGMQQLARCAEMGECTRAGAGKGGCAGLEPSTCVVSTTTSRRKVLDQIRRLLVKHVAAGRSGDLAGWLDDMLPSKHTLVDGLRTLHIQYGAKGGEPPHNLLVAMEKALRVRVLAAGKDVVLSGWPVAAQGADTREGDPEDRLNDEGDRGSSDGDEAVGLGDDDPDAVERGGRGQASDLAQRRGSRRRRQIELQRKRVEQQALREQDESAALAAAHGAPTSRDVARAIFTPKSTVDRQMKITDSDAVARAAKKRRRTKKSGRG